MGAQVALHLHDWTTARRLFRQVALNDEADARVRIEAIAGLGRTGFRDLGWRILRDLDYAARGVVAAWHGSIETLIALGRADHAVEICQNHLARVEVNFLDRVEVALTLGEAYRKDVGASLPISQLDAEEVDLCGRCRAAEILFQLDHAPQARSILFSLEEQARTNPAIDPADLLWLADAMAFGGLSHSAREILSMVPQESLKDEVSRENLQGLNLELEMAEFATS